MAGLDLLGANFTWAGGRKHHPLRAFAMHAEGQLLHVQHDIRDILADTGDGAEFMQDAIDLQSRDGCALQRGKQDAADRVAERHAEAALKRLRHHGGDAGGIVTRLEFELLGLDQRFPISLQYHVRLS